MAILRELWSRQPGTAREIHTDLAAGLPRAFSTTGRFLQIMAARV